MLFFPKKFLTLFVAILLLGIYILPAFVFAADAPAAKEPPMQCWPEELCKQKKGVWATSKSPECIPFNSKETRYCYAPPPDVNLQITIGGAKQVKGITDYIPKIYNYLVAIVSIVATVMIMVGGLQYLTSGGSPGKIGQAKDRILGAVIGIFLVLGAYFLLNTINPALTKLKLPPIKMVRQKALTETQASDCPADSPRKTGQGIALTNCKNDCDCPVGDTCEEVAGEAGQIIAASKLVVWGVTSVAGGAVAGASTVASAGKYIVQGTLSALQSLAKVAGIAVIKAPVPTAVTAGTAYMVVSGLGDSGPASKSVANGICVKLAKKNIPAGGLCAFSSNCISGKCLDLTTKKELTVEQLGDIGVCVGDTKVFEGTLPCTSNTTCFANAGSGSAEEVECVGGFCSWGMENHTCCEQGATVPYGQPISPDPSVVCEDLNGCVIGSAACLGVGTKSCESGLTCTFFDGSAIYPIKGNFSDYTSEDDKATLAALHDAIFKTGGKCEKQYTSP